MCSSNLPFLFVTQTSYTAGTQILHAPFEEDWTRFAQVFSQAGLHLAMFYDNGAFFPPRDAIRAVTDQRVDTDLVAFDLEQLGIAFIWLVVGSGMAAAGAVGEGLVARPEQAKNCLGKMLNGMLQSIAFLKSGPRRLFSR